MEHGMANGKGAGAEMVPLADGSFKLRRDVTEADIMALARTDRYGIAEKVTDADFAVLAMLASESRRDAEAWKFRFEMLQDEIKDAANTAARTKKIVLGVESGHAEMALDAARMRHECLIGAYNDAEMLRRIQSSSSDIIDLYRKFIAEADFSGWQGAEGEK